MIYGPLDETEGSAAHASAGPQVAYGLAFSTITPTLLNIVHREVSCVVALSGR